MKSDLPVNQAENLAGLVMKHLGRLPGDNEEVIIADIAIKVMEKRKNRLLRMRLTKLDKGSK